MPSSSPISAILDALEARAKNVHKYEGLTKKSMNKPYDTGKPTDKSEFKKNVYEVAELLEDDNMAWGKSPQTSPAKSSSK
ncbi:hypothetical protein J3R30DRAFT_3702600 [Lentinula aciculospora]|uniref:Uncharacterized protein n=1 Tax=Lentinula aciculospora TaxID=153920 RepID=A0A9W9ACY7_9AGAR|nr:hypothetical protein J3R30DRAFT_3702600 [Lentinula aciculospora]